MEPIVKPEFKKMMQNIIYSLKNGMKTIYDVLVDVQNVVDTNADSLDKVCNAVVENENERIQNESDRIEDENTRIENETNRLNNEEIRREAEEARIDNESERVANEDERKLNENGRVLAENERANTFVGWKEAIDNSVASVGFSYDDSQEVEKAYLKSTNNKGEITFTELPYASQATAGVMSSYQSFCVDRSLHKIDIVEETDAVKLSTTNNFGTPKDITIHAATETKAGVMSTEDKLKLKMFSTLFADDIAARSEVGLPVQVKNGNTSSAIQLHLKANEQIQIKCRLTGKVDVIFGDDDNTKTMQVLNGTPCLVPNDFGQSVYKDVKFREVIDGFHPTTDYHDFTVTVFVVKKNEVPSLDDAELEIPDVSGGTFPGDSGVTTPKD